MNLSEFNRNWELHEVDVELEDNTRVAGTFLGLGKRSLGTQWGVKCLIFETIPERGYGSTAEIDIEDIKSMKLLAI